MSERLFAHRRRQRSTTVDDLARHWTADIQLAVAVALAYFLAARLSLTLLIEPSGVAVFWPAAGISSGILICLGQAARRPVLAGTMAATIAANLTSDRDIWASAAFAVCNAVEALVTAGLIHHYFGAAFNLDRLRSVLGLLAAAAAGTAISGIGGAFAYKLFHGTTAPMIVIWRDWFASDGVGIVAVAPLVIGFRAAVRDAPPRRELIEGGAVLAALAAMTGIIVSLPPEPWQTVVPGALLLVMLLWLSARCRPVFAAAGAFMVALTIVWTTTFGVGHFGDIDLPIGDRIMQAQAIILVETIGACVLAALFAERRDSEARLARANSLLERERDHKLMNLQVIGASIAHEMKQPLTAIAANGSAGLALLGGEPPDLGEVRAVLNDIVQDSYRASDALDGIRALLRKPDLAGQLVDINDIAAEVLQSLRSECKEHGVAVVMELTSGMPLVHGNRSQLQQVIVNLVHNALEAMAGASNQNRVLRVRTELRDAAIAVVVRDSGPGIDPKNLDEIFEALVTTKAHGMGLGLAICRLIIERHGGQLTASSDGRSGAQFEFVLPTATAQAAPEAATTSSQAS